MTINFYLTPNGFADDTPLSFFLGLEHMMADIGWLNADDITAASSQYEREYLKEKSAKRKKENQFFVCEETLTQTIDGEQLCDLCFDSSLDCEQLQAIQALLMSINNSTEAIAKPSLLSYDDVLQLASGNNEDICVGFLGMEKSAASESGFSTVYDKSTCLHLRREYWKRYLMDSAHFIDQIKTYFDHLAFANEATTMIRPVFPECKCQVIDALQALDDAYFHYVIVDGHMTDVNSAKAVWLKASSHQEVTSQGVDKKNKLCADKTFVANDGSPITLFCELHFKFLYPDKEGSLAFSNDRRLYFHDPHPDVWHGKRVLVGHIGGHL